MGKRSFFRLLLCGILGLLLIDNAYFQGIDEADFLLNTTKNRYFYLHKKLLKEPSRMRKLFSVIQERAGRAALAAGVGCLVSTILRYYGFWPPFGLRLPRYVERVRARLQGDWRTWARQGGKPESIPERIDEEFSSEAFFSYLKECWWLFIVVTYSVWYGINRAFPLQKCYSSRRLTAFIQRWPEHKKQIPPDFYDYFETLYCLYQHYGKDQWPLAEPVAQEVLAMIGEKIMHDLIHR